MASRLFDLPVERPVLAAAINLLLIAVGIGCALVLPVREYPQVDPPIVSVTTFYRGAPAEVVEREITRQIEDELSGIDGVRLIESQSRNETSDIDIEFEAGRDIDAAAADVRDKVSAAREDLPQDVDEPIIEKTGADDFPVIWITLTSDEIGIPELTDVADRLISDSLGTVPGVARIIIGGERRYAMRIWLDREALAARNLTPGDVADRLRAENVELPAGRLETEAQEITLRTDTRFSRPEEFATLVLRDQGGVQVRLGDVARVEIGAEEYRRGFSLGDRPAVAVGVVRQSEANTLEVAAGVKEVLERIRPQLPGGITAEIGYDESVFISETLRNVGVTLLQTVGIIVVVIYLFLGSVRATLIPAATIPASVIPAAMAAAALGFSVNVLSVLAVILAIGLCVDDAVVIMENVRRRQQEEKEPLLLASVRATRQVGVAVFASALVLVAVILPLGFIQGTVGRLFREFAVVLAAIVAFSTIAALTLGPMLSSKLFGDANKKEGRLARWVGRGLGWTGERYKRALSATLARPVLPALAALAFAGLGVAAFLALPSELAPDEDRGSVSVVVEAPEGASFQYTSAKLRELNAAVGDLARPDGPAEQVLGIVAPGRGGASSPEVNTGRLIVRLKPWDDRDLGEEEIRGDLRRRLSSVPGVRAFAVSPPKLGQRGNRRPLQFVIGGVERGEVVEWANTVVAEAQGAIPGLASLDTDYKDTKPQIDLAVDRPRAAALGVDVAEVGLALQVMFGSLEVTRYVERGEEYEVVLQAEDEDRRDPTDVENVFVRARGAEGGLVPLSSVVRLEETGVARELVRVDRLPAVTLEANLTPGVSLGDALTKLDEIAAARLPPEARISYKGESLNYREASSSIYAILGLVLVVVFLVLAGQFESFLHPLVILTSAPLALAGGLVSLWLFGLTLNIYSQIGMVLLIGLVAKNAILLVEFANQLREDGRDPKAAVEEAAAARLRPILMTTVATILGALPLAIASGAGAEAQRTIGLVTSGGLAFGTLLTLFVVPAFYVLIGERAKVAGDLRREVERMESEAGKEDEGRGEPEPRPAE